MKKILIIVCIISLITLVAASLIIKSASKTKPNIHYPEYTNLTVETEAPKSTNVISVPVVSFNPNEYNSPKKTLIPSVPVSAVSGETSNYSGSGEIASGDIQSGDRNASGDSINPITPKEYAQDNIIFLLDNHILCSLIKGQWNFNNIVKPSTILGQSSYYTYNYKGVRNISNTITATCSIKYKEYTGTFAEPFKTIATTFNNNNYVATFQLPIYVPEGMDTVDNYNGGEIKLGDNSYFATNASYTIKFAQVTANAYDPFEITNILDGGYNRKMISVPDSVKEYLWGVIAENGISPEVYYEISYTCDYDMDRDGQNEILYFITSKTGNNNSIEYDYLAEYGHMNLILFQNKDGIRVIYGDYLPAQLTEEEIKQSGVYNTAVYRPTIADLNDDGFYEIICYLRKEDKTEQLMYILDNNEYVKVK